jgi:hypothetical protein
MKRAERSLERSKDRMMKFLSEKQIELLTSHEMNVELIKKLIEVNEVFLLRDSIYTRCR